VVARDHEFWSRYSERLIGNWITYDTPAQEICDFAVRVYERKNYEGFQGDRKFVRDKQAQKAFSKLRSSIGGLYLWRMNNIPDPEENARMSKEAEFALKQAFAFCPYSPEAVYRYTDLLARSGRLEDAERVAETCLRFDPDNPAIQNLLVQVQALRSGRVELAPPPSGAAEVELARLQEQYLSNRNDGEAAFRLASLYLQLGRSNNAVRILDELASSPQADVNTVLSVATVFAEMGQGELLEKALSRLVALTPDNPEAWYDLASTQAVLRKDEALRNLTQAIRLSDARRAIDSNARDLRLDAATNTAFDSLRDQSKFQDLMDRP
jgi:tetratricopeptide (TPR) repeat protein